MAANSIQQLYVAYFGRPADADSLVYWDKALAASPGSLAAIAQAFTRSTEFQARLDPKQGIGVVDVFYKNMFGRAADDAGKLYWNSLLDKGASVESVVIELGKAAQGADLIAFQAKASAAAASTAQMDTPDEIGAYTKTHSHPPFIDFISYVHDANTLDIATSPWSLRLLTATMNAGSGKWTVPADHDALVQKLYLAYFSRAADPAGYAYWGDMLSGDPFEPNVTTVADAFGKSLEFRDAYPQAGNVGKLNAIHQNLFARDVYLADLPYALAWLDAGQSMAQVVAMLIRGPRPEDLAILNFKAQVASAITTALDTPREQLAYATFHADQLVTTYLAQVRDERTWRAAIQPEAIDALIFSFSGNTGPVPPPAASALVAANLAPAELVPGELVPGELALVGLAAPMHDYVLL